jgi:hypothetical protein
MVFEALMAEGSSRLLLIPRCYCPRALAAMTKRWSFSAIAECDVAKSPNHSPTMEREPHGRIVGYADKWISAR